MAFASVDEYIASQPAASQRLLSQVRAAIRNAVPEAQESMSYHMPTYKRNGSVMLYFAGWKKHYSLYPATAAILEAFQNELEPYQVEKGTIRFPLTEPVPVKLIEGIAKLRAKQTASSQK